MIRTYKYSCLNCGKEFWNRDKRYKCCSHKCSGEYVHKTRGTFGLLASSQKPLLELKCAECGNEFKTRERFRNRFKNNFCSMGCYNVYKIKNNLLKGIQKKGHKNFSQEFIEASRQRMLGNKYRAGMKHTAEWREKQTLRRMGSKCNFWKGGIHKFRGQYGYLFSIQLKEKIRVRDNFKCQICGIPELELTSRLSVHHIDYDKKNSDENNLICLCKSCHNKTTVGNREYYQELLQKGVSR